MRKNIICRMVVRMYVKMRRGETTGAPVRPPNRNILEGSWQTDFNRKRGDGRMPLESPSVSTYHNIEKPISEAHALENGRMTRYTQLK